MEIQALWYAGLRFLDNVDKEGPWRGLADRVSEAMVRLYPMESTTGERYLSDCLHAAPGQGAGRAEPDNALRPNQLLAVTLGAVRDPALCRSILTACESLLVPGAIRSLADQSVSPPLPIHGHGRLLNNPDHPYWGQYRGDEDTRRKPAYHNGTAWTWIFPSYAEALVATYGKAAQPAALALLGSSIQAINQGCATQVPEIMDGDTPHTLRGCGAQAWGTTELYRVVAMLAGNH